MKDFILLKFQLIKFYFVYFFRLKIDTNHKISFPNYVEYFLIESLKITIKLWHLQFLIIYRVNNILFSSRKMSTWQQLNQR